MSSQQLDYAIACPCADCVLSAVFASNSDIVVYVVGLITSLQIVLERLGDWEYFKILYTK
jgi:hypothetical protein